MSPETTTDLLNKLLTIAFPVSLVTALFANLINKVSNDKNQSLKYITEERAKWREFVKISASKIYSGEYNEKETEKYTITHLILSLNPLQYTSDNNLDNRIRELLGMIERGNRKQEVLEEFRYCVGTLLKYDWERSKNEAKPWIKRELDDTLKRRFLHKYYLENDERKIKK
ncbi:hypothetical protein SAMN04487895_101581 [Paenibacillus sophorae]|uniref:Uncharacterized protein n=1 Tax=Paenibacillus sophorae TaxID=1333845 RepID=A0A1H8GMM8_9BACL|nr:hypothetical protein [Paenibacillus sophorae]QWU14283.1 hypothetical protein KP014_20465 [Paenibacillus sophorae]SEN45401.1 hypothetical protein SAMN04487895_101581 [Paenibacillus sophorae]